MFSNFLIKPQCAKYSPLSCSDKAVHPSLCRPSWNVTAAFPRRTPVTRCAPARVYDSCVIQFVASFSYKFPTMQFEYDPERLIEEVRKRPGIWDYQDTEYRAKNMRYRLWNEVVTELMNSDVKVSKSEMRELEIQLQKKWKSIRDCFQKYISNPNRTKRPYIYCRQLQFLLKDQDVPQKDEGNAATSESDEDKPIKKKKVWRYKKKLKLVKDEETSEEDNETTFDVALDDSRDYTDTVETARPSKVSKMSKPDEFAFASVDAQVKPESDDPDRMFLLSLLPHFKSVPEELRLNVKMELMQVLRNANYNTVREHKLI